MKKKIALALLFGVVIATAAAAQTPPYPPDYIDKPLYSPPVYAKAQDWVTCSLANYFPDQPIYAEIKIYDTEGTQVYPVNGATTPPTTQQQQPPPPAENVIPTPPWGVSYVRYQVTADGYYWCWLTVYKPNDPAYEGWGRATYAYEPAGTGYPVSYVPVYEEKTAVTPPTQ